MNYLEWKQFIKDIVKQGPKITNLKEECRKNHVGLNTLYRKLSILEETDYELYKQFISLHPYVPRDIQGVDFEQLMRESILTGISQKDLEIKYGVDKRTIQRKFANIKKDNSRLHEIYKRYTKLKKGESLHHSIIDEVASEYTAKS